VASFYPLAYAAGMIAGDGARVVNLTPPGAEPHDIELTPQQVAEIQRARAVLYLGDGFQPAVERALNGNGVDLLQGLPVRDGDPHVWLDPLLYARVVRRIGQVLHRQSPQLVAALRRLDRSYRTGLARCARHEIVTSHAAFGYLARRYGLRQIAITGITPESEPAPRQIAHVVAVVRKTHATTVFFERLLSPRLADTVAHEVGTETAVLDPIEGLAPSETGRETYLTLMQQNLAALRKALGCR
jgi:zinc transport system substrate-binding protein